MKCSSWGFHLSLVPKTTYHLHNACMRTTNSSTIWAVWSENWTKDSETRDGTFLMVACTLKSPLVSAQDTAIYMVGAQSDESRLLDSQRNRVLRGRSPPTTTDHTMQSSRCMNLQNQFPESHGAQEPGVILREPLIPCMSTWKSFISPEIPLGLQNDIVSSFIIMAHIQCVHINGTHILERSKHTKDTKHAKHTEYTRNSKSNKCTKTKLFAVSIVSI